MKVKCPKNFKYLLQVLFTKLKKKSFIVTYKRLLLLNISIKFLYIFNKKINLSTVNFTLQTQPMFVHWKYYLKILLKFFIYI